MWSEIQQIDEDVKEKLVSTDTTTAAARRIGDLKVPRDKLPANLVAPLLAVLD